MSAAITLFTKAKLAISEEHVDLSNDTFKVMLVGTGFTFGSTASPSSIANTAIFVGDTGVASTEFDGTNYGRVSLSAVSLTQSNATLTFTAGNTTFTTLGVGSTDVQGAIIFQFITNDSDSRLIAFYDFGGNITPNGNNFLITWNASGIFTIV